MKTKMTLAAIIIMAFITIAASPAPERVSIIPRAKKQVSQNIFGDFAFLRLHRQTRNGATITWGMNSESGINGYTVQRTYEDPTDPYAFWENIASMPSTSSRSYKWTDGNLFPGFISYRIMANMTNGGSIFSEILTIHIIGH